MENVPQPFQFIFNILACTIFISEVDLFHSWFRYSRSCNCFRFSSTSSLLQAKSISNTWKLFSFIHFRADVSSAISVWYFQVTFIHSPLSMYLYFQYYAHFLLNSNASGWIGVTNSKWLQTILKKLSKLDSLWMDKFLKSVHDTTIWLILVKELTE